MRMRGKVNSSHQWNKGLMSLFCFLFLLSAGCNTADKAVPSLAEQSSIAIAGSEQAGGSKGIVGEELNKDEEDLKESMAEDFSGKVLEAENESQADDAKNSESKNIVVSVDQDGYRLSNDSSDFVSLSEEIPDAILEIRYYSTYNFVGERIDGYEEPIALLTKEAAAALREVSDELVEKGYRLKIYDAYRPQKAVTHFVNWALEKDNILMKEYFYPDLDKGVLFSKGYIAKHSGHSRGSTVDLTLFDMETGKEVDMGGTFDYFGEISHANYTGITKEQQKNRKILHDAMIAHGFKGISQEWWHFTLKNEPFPDTYFTFSVSCDSLAE